LWDWAEGEPDNDLTKSYPFPVPRVRKISNEFTMATCVTDLDSSSSKSSDEDTMVVPSIHYESELPLTHNESIEPMKSTNRNLSHSSSDSDLLVVPNPSRRHTTTTYHNKSTTVTDKYHSIPRRFKRRPTRHFTFVKSIVVEPPNANQEDVSKARYKLQNKAQALHDQV